ncbi:MAG: M3 family metallopeptidase [Legionellales bacterium]|nr:M3 family metallopeptidase [Legionellales bacterium]
MTNPLLRNDTLPAFKEIDPQHVEVALDTILENNRQAIQQLLNQSTFNWENTIHRLEMLDTRLNDMFSPVAHLNSVLNSEALNEVYSQCLPKISAYMTEVGQNEALFKAIKNVNEDPNLNADQKKLLSDSIKNFHLAGVDLAPEAKQQFAEISQKLSTLANEFEQNILKCSDAWSFYTEDPKKIAGLPPHIQALTEEEAKQQNLTGWLLKLEIPIYFAVMTYADDRELRQLFYTAYNTRASDQGMHDKKYNNDKIMFEILSLKLQLAQLLGFKNYAERSLATKMVKKPQEVLDFLNSLAQQAKPTAHAEYAELQEFARKQFAHTELLAWDVAYYAEKLRQQRYDISQEDLRPYFPEDRVLNGMFTIIHQIFGMTVTENKQVETWHQQVKFYDIVDESGEKRGSFYLDLYARAHKRGGAWMDDCRTRHLDEHHQLHHPVAFLTCNFSAPVGNQPALFTHDEVTTLFHEFGHTLHHLLTQVNYADIAGINGVPWDAVEFPSQFMENFCWQRETLDLISGHFQTQEKIPDNLHQKMLNAKNFQAAMKLVRQLEFGLFDFRLHMEFNPNTPQQIQTILNEVRKQIAVVQAPDFNRFQNSFSHIFAGGYAAGYYSYLWAEVMAEDGFAKFIEEGVLNPQTGREFLHCILERGGAESPEALFMRFRGRKPEISALLKAYNIQPADQN